VAAIPPPRTEPPAVDPRTLTACPLGAMARIQLTVLCAVLDVSKSGFYAWVVRAKSIRQIEDSRRDCPRERVEGSKDGCILQRLAANSGTLLERG